MVLSTSSLRPPSGEAAPTTTSEQPADPGATQSNAGGGKGSSFWLEVDNNHETGTVTVEVWSRGEPPRVVFTGEMASFRWDGNDSVIELRRVNRG